MAIITEVPDHDPPKPQLRKPKPKSKTKPKPTSKSNPTSPPPPPSPPSVGNPFQFWFYFTVFVSLLTLSTILLSSLSLSPQHDPKTWFLNLPPLLRHHYSSGRTIKVQTAPNLPQLELFSIQQGPISSHTHTDTPHVLILHGLGCSSFSFINVLNLLGRRNNVHAVAVDLPGSGFSDKSVSVVEFEEGFGNGVFGGVWEVYEEIREKGLFWGFDQLVEKGYVDFEEDKDKAARVKKKREVVNVKAVELGSEEMGRVLGQVVESMELGPVDLVLHDSALVLAANWIAENPGLVRSVVVLDGGTGTAAFPLWVLSVPLVREVVLGFRFVFDSVLARCCVESAGGTDSEAHRILLKGRDGGRAVAGIGKKLNASFDVSEWSRLDGVKSLPIRLIWSEKWSDEGSRIADAIPQATLVTHSGGRWIQEGNAEEVAESIYEFISSLPKVTRQIVEEPIREHVHGMSNGAENSYHEHHHHHHDDGHGGHSHGHAGYMDAYGLGHGWAM